MYGTITMTNKDERNLLKMHEDQQRAKGLIANEPKPDRDVLVVDKEQGVIIKVFKQSVTEERGKLASVEAQKMYGDDYIFPIVEHGKYGFGKVYKI